MWQRSIRWLSRGEAILLHLSAVSVLVIAAIICYGIVARSMRWPGLPDDILIVRQMMMGAIAAALGYATATRSHIAIDLFYDMLPGGLKKLCDIVAPVVGLVAVGPLCYWAMTDLRHSIATGAYSYGKLHLPEWPAQSAFFLGLLVMTIRLVVLLAADPRQGGAGPEHSNVEEV